MDYNTTKNTILETLELEQFDLAKHMSELLSII